MYGKLVKIQTGSGYGFESDRKAGPDQKKSIPDLQHWKEWQKTMALGAFNTCAIHLFSTAVPTRYIYVIFGTALVI
jgi:hypothetical protein